MKIPYNSLDGTTPVRTIVCHAIASANSIDRTRLDVFTLQLTKHFLVLNEASLRGNWKMNSCGKYWKEFSGKSYRNESVRNQSARTSSADHPSHLIGDWFDGRRKRLQILHRVVGSRRSVGSVSLEGLQSRSDSRTGITESNCSKKEKAKQT